MTLSQITKLNKSIRTNEEYSKCIFNCIEKGCSLEDTITELLGELEIKYPTVAEQISKHYRKTLSEILTQLILSAMSRKCLERDRSFFELVAKSNLGEDASFWEAFMIFGVEEPRFLQRQMRSMEVKEQKSLFASWSNHLERLLPYFSPQKAEFELVRTIKAWLSSDKFTEENDREWIKFIYRSSRSIDIQKLKNVHWTREETQEFSEFIEALQNFKFEQLSSDTDEKLSKYLHDVFDFHMETKSDVSGTILTVSKKILFLSKHCQVFLNIIKKIITEKNIYEIRIYGSKLLVLNCDFEQKWFHGINLIFAGSTLLVQGKVNIDLSGNSKISELRGPAESGIEKGSNGADGTDGAPGESSGNLVFYIDTILHPDNLYVRLNGGSGQGGQNGGDGADGTDGERVTKAELEEYRLQANTPENNFSRIGEPKIGGNLLNRWGYNSFQHKNGRIIECSYHTVLDWERSGYVVFYGTIGGAGGIGGKNGLGGEGGTPGKLDVLSRSIDKSVIRNSETKPGADGEHGKCGKNGKAGATGNDMAKIVPLFIPRREYYIGEAGSSKLKATFYPNNDNPKACLSGYRKYGLRDKNHYCVFEEAEIEPPNEMERGGEETTERTAFDRNSSSKAVNRPTIPQDEIKNEFASNYRGDHLDFIVEDIVINVGENTSEYGEEEKEVKQELSAAQTRTENVVKFEVKLQETLSSTKKVDKKIELVKINKRITEDEMQDWMAILNDALTVPLDMNKHKEKICSMMTKLKSSVFAQKQPQLVKNVKDKMLLSVDAQIENDYEKDHNYPASIQPNGRQLLDVACGSRSWEFDSYSTRKDVVNKLESENKAFLAPKKLLLALHDVYLYLKEHEEIFLPFAANLKWSNVSEVKKHLQKCLPEKEREQGDDAIEDAIEVQESLDDSSTPDKKGVLHELKRQKKKAAEKGTFWMHIQTTFKAVENLLSDENKSETAAAFDNLDKYFVHSPEISKRFALKKDFYGHPIKFGSTAVSLIHMFFLSKQMLEFNLKLHRYLDRYRQKVTAVDWFVEDKSISSIHDFVNLVRSDGFELPSKTFFDDLRNNGLKASAYRLLISEEKNLNIQVFSPNGFAKVRLVEDNNPEGKEKHYMILSTSGKLSEAVPNNKVRKMRALINCVEKNILLSDKAVLSNFTSSVAAAQIEEWSAAIIAATGSTLFLKFLHRLFELRGCSETLTELQFIINTYIEAVCNYGISEEQMCCLLQGQHGSFKKISLPLRLIAAAANCNQTLDGISKDLDSITDSRLRALFGAKLQGNELNDQDIRRIVQMLSHDDCFSDLEQRSLSEWIDISKCQQWDNYDHLMKDYGPIGYYFVLMDSSDDERTRTWSIQLKEVIDTLSKPRILLERIISRLTFLFIFNEISADKNNCGQWKELLEELSFEGRKLIEIANEDIKTKQTKNVIAHEKTQSIIIDSIRRPHITTMRNVFPTQERKFSQLIRIAFPAADSVSDIFSFVRNVLKGGEKRKKEKKKRKKNDRILDFMLKIDDGLKEWTADGIHKMLRNTQKIAVLASYYHKKNLLVQVNTGEGKSLIIAALSILKVLVGGPMTHVDIITSSSVLAIRDSETLRPFYARFGISVNHNCDADVEKRKEAYKCHVVYGDILQFERDYLLHEYYNKNVLGSRTQENVIVDESDSMCLDHGNNMLYLSHAVPGLELLESLFVFIHKEVYSKKTADKQESMTSQLRKHVLSDLFGTVTKEDIAQLLGEQQTHSIWKLLSKHKVIGDEGILLNASSEDMQTFAKEMKTDFGETTTMSLLAMIHIVEQRHREIIVPEYLKPFILLHLEEFINNAYKALSLKNADEFIVDLDRNKTGSDIHPRVTIVDKGTGTDMANSQWSGGLHQFLQLKYGCRLTAISLKAVFISNVTYLKQYKKINGFSGTLGSEVESKSLRKLYDADVIQIPTWKPKNFYEKIPVLCTSLDDWIASIANCLHEIVIEENRSILLICPSIDAVEKLRDNLLDYMQKKRAESAYIIETAKLYTRDHEDFDFGEAGVLKPGQLILSTNLAGRGTDIVLSKELIGTGGLHVIISFLPENSRIEEQAFGRAARSGDPGSGQIICLNDKSSGGAKNIFQLKQFRNNAEIHRLQSLEQIYNFRIRVEETCLRIFQDHCNESLKEISTMKEDELPSIQQIVYFSLLDKWALWLDGQAENIKHCEKSANEGEKLHVIKMAEKFLKEHPLPKSESISEILASLKWIKAPQPLVNIALTLISLNHKSFALLLLDTVLAMHPDYSAEALYYKGILRQQGIRQYKEFKQDLQFEKNWHYVTRALPIAIRGVSNFVSSTMQCYGSLEDLPDNFVGHDESCMKEATDLLIRSRSAFLAKIKEIGRMGKVIDMLKQNTGQHLISRGYEVQHEESISLLEAVVGNIEDIIGHTVTVADFSLQTDDYNRSFARKRDYQSLGLTSPVVLISQLTLASVLEAAHTNAVPVQMLYQCLNRIQNSQEKTFNDRKIVDIKALETLPLPSVNGFWECLRKRGCFLFERYFIGFDKQLKKIPELDFKETELQVGPFDVTREIRDCQKYVYYQCTMKEIKNAAVEAQTLEAIESGFAYVEIVGTLNIPMLKETKRLSHFDYITRETVMIELGIMKSEAELILTRMENERILTKMAARNGTNIREIFILDGPLDCSTFPKNIQPALELLLNRHFSYGYALKCLKSSVTRCLNGENVEHKILLPLNPYKDLYHSLISHGILVDNRVTQYFPEYFEEYEQSLSSFKKLEGIEKELYDRLRNKAPWITVNSCKLKNSSEYFREKNVPACPELRQRFANGMRQVACIEKPNKWKWYFGVFTIALLIMCPLFVTPVIGLILFAAVGTALYFMNMFSENRKLFSKYEADDHEEFKVLLSSHKVAVDTASQYSAKLDGIKKFQIEKNKFNNTLKKFILSHATTNVQFSDSTTIISQCLEKSQILPDLKKFLYCFISHQIKRQLKNNDNCLFDVDVLHVVISFVTTIVADINKLLPENKRFPEKIYDPILDKTQLMEMVNGNHFPENLTGDFNLQLYDVLSSIVDDILETKGEQLYNEFSAVDRAAFSSGIPSNCPDDELLQSKSSQYNSELLSQEQKSDFMHKDLHNIFLKMCFTENKPSFLVHMIKYNYPMSAHSAPLLFKAVITLFNNVCIYKTHNFELRRNQQPIYKFEATRPVMKEGKTLQISIQLTNNLFCITEPELGNNSQSRAPGLYETLSMECEQFNSKYSLACDAFQKDLIEIAFNMPTRFNKTWNIQETWHSNEKLIPPVNF